MKPMKKIALLHSLCSVGKASLTNMIPILELSGVEACPIPTILLSTHTGGYGIPAKHEISAEYIRSCADHYREQDVEFDVIFVGYLGSDEMSLSIQYFLEQFPRAQKIIDPIMGDHGKLYKNITAKRKNAYESLCAFANILLPNFTEACLLTDSDYQLETNIEHLQTICNKLHSFGANELIITDVCFENNQRCIAHSKDGILTTVPVQYETESFHGTGDIFDAVIIHSYLQKKSQKECILDAHDFVRKCIRESISHKYPKREGVLLENVLAKIV